MNNIMNFKLEYKFDNISGISIMEAAKCFEDVLRSKEEGSFKLVKLEITGEQENLQ